MDLQQEKIQQKWQLKQTKLINVFIPTTPNPTSGFLLMFPIDDIIYLNMTFEEASKFIVSAGTSSEIIKQYRLLHLLDHKVSLKFVFIYWSIIFFYFLYFTFSKHE